MLSWYLLLKRLTMLEIYNNERILSAQGIEVGNLNYATLTTPIHL